MSVALDCDYQFHKLIQSTLGVLSGMNCVTSPFWNLYPFGLNKTLSRKGLPPGNAGPVTIISILNVPEPNNVASISFRSTLSTLSVRLPLRAVPLNPFTATNLGLTRIKVRRTSFWNVILRLCACGRDEEPAGESPSTWSSRVHFRVEPEKIDPACQADSI